MATINEAVFRYSMLDWDKQPKQFSLPATVLTAANHDAQKALYASLVTSMEAVTLGALDFKEIVADRESIRPRVAAAAPTAQVNIEWVVTYVDDVNSDVRNVKIPCADLTDATLLMPNTNIWDPTDAKWVTFAADFEAYVLSDEGNAVTVTQVVYDQ